MKESKGSYFYYKRTGLQTVKYRKNKDWEKLALFVNLYWSLAKIEY